MKVLLVIAHPDDECMFFCPSLSRLQKRGGEVHVLCLSSGKQQGRLHSVRKYTYVGMKKKADMTCSIHAGDCHGLGQRRKCELYMSCSVLGIPRRHVQIIEDDGLRDGMGNVWEQERVKQYVVQCMRDIRPDIVLSFDKYGVSGHLNHSGTAAGVLLAYRTCCQLKDLQGMSLYILKSSNIVTKYSGILSYAFIKMLYRANGSCLFHSFDLRRAWQAMSCHQTQWTWYRRFFILFSQYTFFNLLCDVRYI